MAKRKITFHTYQTSKSVLKIITLNIIKHFHVLVRRKNWSGLSGWQFGKMHQEP